MPLHANTAAFYGSDWQHTLFPLESTHILLQHGQAVFSNLIYDRILAQEDLPNFQQQVRVYADKSGGHLRRTMKLDPVAEVFIYDIVYRNRNKLPPDALAGRKAFGYRFRNGEPILAGASYRAFRTAARTAAMEFAYSLECDISAYFNSIYHHDLEHFYRAYWKDEDTDSLGLFLRQVNGGRSIDCMPQGIMPAKILGHHFLRFVDYSGELSSSRILRFMDDIILFSDSIRVLHDDFVVLQQLLGERGLNVNPRKTAIGYSSNVHSGQDMEDVRRELLAVRRERLSDYDDDDGDEEEGDDDSDDDTTLTSQQLEYLNDLLSKDDIEEHDAELILDVMSDYAVSVIEHIPTFLQNFPNLSRSIHRFCNAIDDREQLSQILQTYIRDYDRISEYQLFWLAKIARDHLSETVNYGDILHALYGHASATTVSRSAVLEIPERRWGLRDLRRPHLRSGQSDWCAWAAAVGSRNETRAERNHLMTYFANSGPVNELVSRIVRDMP